ncbi:MAG: FecR family protein [Gammaproteobacteria bacterium]|nr:FecR family protein [Gammaproteobacteria bacterium]
MILQRSLLVASAFAFTTGALASEPSPFTEGNGGIALLVAQNDAAAGKPAGQIVITTSDLRASRDDGSERALGRRSVIYEGDTLITGENGIAQVRMVDGALLSLRRETRFKIEEFKYGDVRENEERGFFSLLRGGFRTITGAIGQVVKQAYRVSTPVATIGIRGTHYGLRLCTDGDCASEGVDENGLFGGVVDGSISSRNDAGSSNFANDEYFHVADVGSVADSLLAPPGVVFGSDLPPPTTDSVSGLNSLSPEADAIQEGQQQAANDALDSNLLEVVLTDDTNAAVPTVTLPGAFNNTVLTNARVAPDNSVAVTSFLLQEGLTTMFGNAFGAQNTNVGGLESSSFVVLYNDDGSVPAMQNVDDANCSPCIAFAQPGTTTVVAGSEGSNVALGVNWGRWQGDWIGTGQDTQGGGTSAGQLHFMYSDSLVPQASLPSSGSFNYTNTGGTAPTNHAGVAGVLNSASVQVDFGNQAIVGYDLNLTVDSDNVTASINPNVGSVGLSNAANGGILLSGSCTGPCGSAETLTGRASADFVGGVSAGANGDRPNGLISSYALGGNASDTSVIGYSGTFVAEPTN